MKLLICVFLTVAQLTVIPLCFAGDNSSSPYAESTLTKVGGTSPVLSVRTVEGQTVDFQGKVVLLNFFATWCGPCMAEMPRLEKDIWDTFKSRGMILVSVGREHSESEVKAFQQQKKFSFLFAADPKREIYGKFATQYIPRCILIGKDGRIKHQSIGFTEGDFAALTEAVKTELGK